MQNVIETLTDFSFFFCPELFTLSKKFHTKSLDFVLNLRQLQAKRKVNLKLLTTSTFHNPNYTSSCQTGRSKNILCIFKRATIHLKVS